MSKNDTSLEIQQKVERYLEAGVRLVWVVRPRLRTVAIHQPGESPVTLGTANHLTAGDIIPGLSFPIARLLN